MSAKKKSKARKRGVSGNPQRRAEQARPDPAARALAYKMAGGADPAPWWPESHRRVLDAARAAAWPADPAGIEALTTRIVGGELHERLRRHRDGHQFAQWLVMLTETAGTDPDLRPLLRGITLIAPLPPEGDSTLARHFPSVKDPYGAAVAECERTGEAVPELRPAGTPLVARDAYGSRFLLAAPFSYGSGNGESRHWYAWDVDACWIDEVVAAGTFGSSDEALAEWRDAVGARARDAELSECEPDLAVRLLRQPLETGPFAEYVKGDEPAELMREYYRQRRRAREVAVRVLGGKPPGPAFVVDMDAAREEFLSWYAERHGRETAPAGMAEAVDTITDQWGPHKDVDDPGFFACSPHRIETAARLIRNGHYGEHATPAIRLLPEWTRWCAERGGVTAGAAALGVTAAREASDALAGVSAAVPAHADPAPFRRPE